MKFEGYQLQVVLIAVAVSIGVHEKILNLWQAAALALALGSLVGLHAYKSKLR